MHPSAHTDPEKPNHDAPAPSPVDPDGGSPEPNDTRDAARLVALVVLTGVSLVFIAAYLWVAGGTAPG